MFFHNFRNIFKFFGFGWGALPPDLPVFGWGSNAPQTHPAKWSSLAFDRGGQTGRLRSNAFFVGAADDPRNDLFLNFFSDHYIFFSHNQI